MTKDGGEIMKEINIEIAAFIDGAEPHIGTMQESDLFLNLKGENPEEREGIDHEDQ